MKGKHKKTKSIFWTVRILLIAILVVAFGFSCWKIISILTEQSRESTLYSDLESEHVDETQLLEAVNAGDDETNDQWYTVENFAEDLPEEETETFADVPDIDCPVDFEGLKAENPDVCGWLYIPDTLISYPVMTCKDNSEYLHKAWDGSYAYAGSIFMDFECDAGFGNRHTVLYGHNMNNGSMFGTLKKYKDEEYLKAHPYIYVILPTEVREYQIISVRNVLAVTASYPIYFDNDEEFLAYQREAIAESEIDTGTEPGLTHLLTLSTCTGGGYKYRLVVQALRVR